MYFVVLVQYILTFNVGNEPGPHRDVRDETAQNGFPETAEKTLIMPADT